MAAHQTACRPEPHSRLTVQAGTLLGKAVRDSDAARVVGVRTGLADAAHDDFADVRAGHSARSSAAEVAVAPSWWAGTPLNTPPKLPIGVRAPSTMTIFSSLVPRY